MIDGVRCIDPFQQPQDFWVNLVKSGMVSRMHNNAIDINDIGRGYNHREHRGTQRDTEDQFNNSVPSVVKSGGFYRLCGIDLTIT